MSRPGDLSDRDVLALRDTYSVEQLVELTLKVLKFNTQKVAVTLGTHRWITADEIDAMPWNRNGAYVVAAGGESTSNGAR